MQNTPNAFDDFFYMFGEYAMHAIWCAGFFTMVICGTGLVLGTIGLVIAFLVIAIKDRGKGDGTPEETGQGVVEDKEQGVTEGEDKEKESFV